MRVLARGFLAGSAVEVRCPKGCAAPPGAVEAWTLGGPDGATLSDFAGPVTCGACGKVLAVGTADPDPAPDVLEAVCGWCPAPVLIRSGRVLAGPVPPPEVPVSHGICLACSARMIAKMPSPGPVVAGRMVAEAARPEPVSPWCPACRFTHGPGLSDCAAVDRDPDGDFLR